MKKSFKFFSTILIIVFCFTLCSFKIGYADECLYLGGMPAGFTLNTKGVEVVGVCDVITEQGLVSPLKTSGIQEGDIILSINGCEINNAVDLKNSIKNKSDAVIEFLHCDQKYIKNVKSAKDINGQYKLGVYIRDSISGIGTITFVKGDRFASLGHPVINSDGKLLNISGGSLYKSKITGYVKGIRGRAGELKGVFVKQNAIATIDKNLDCGVFGTITKQFNTDSLIKTSIGKASIGDAYIYSTIDDCTPKKYSISIVKIDEGNNKNFVVKITDKELLSTTGGIVQGMSGSPIIQNNKLVGAITHVFINDPTRGFGIKIDNMINNWYKQFNLYIIMSRIMYKILHITENIFIKEG